MLRLRKAILIIHGFAGSLYDNEHLMNYLEYDRMFDVYAKTLPGHDQDNFKNAKYTDWITFIDEAVLDLINRGYSSIYVVGHSMGGVLTSIVASRYKQIKKIVLVNAAFNYLNFKQNKLDLFDNKDFDKYKVAIDKAFKTSPLMVLEFAKLVKENKNVLSDVHCNVLILQSREDEIIPVENGEFIYENIASDNKYLTYLNDCSHVALKGERKEEISTYIWSYLKGGLRWRKQMKKEL